MATNDSGSGALVAIGPSLGRVLDVARAAGLPVLLTGRHGIGKSEYLEGYARARGIVPYVLDLSLLEATDLTGMPFIERGATQFAPPATLPSQDAEGPTMLVLDELNRCDRSVRQPCLQMLTARRLNQYRLPKDCFLAASVNPPDEQYEVDEIDDALASRFVKLRVEPDRAAWVDWARGAGVNEVVVRLVENSPQAFDGHPPRTWTFAARLLESALSQGVEEIERVLRTVLGPISTQALLRELLGGLPGLPKAKVVVADPKAHVALVKKLKAEKRLDALKLLFDLIAEYGRTEEGRAAIAPAQTRDALVKLGLEAPPDLTRALTSMLAELPR